MASQVGLTVRPHSPVVNDCMDVAQEMDLNEQIQYATDLMMAGAAIMMIDHVERYDIVRLLTRMIEMAEEVITTGAAVEQSQEPGETEEEMEARIRAAIAKEHDDKLRNMHKD